MSYINIQIPNELKKKIADALTKASAGGKIRKGMNETTKAVERAIAKLVVLAEDVSPPEVVMHLPILCNEKKVPYAFLTKKEDLGKAVGLEVGCSAIAVVEAGDADADIKDVIEKVAQLK
ncbi:MAG: 50S ribosomal protein L7 [Promethearchaeota archaeon CR_4]|nr:MAG: 50S ribosomal protein L7 [Candidatus Lokiarchaeota archaeon CR_4]